MKKVFYQCFSEKQKDFLLSRGCRYEFVAKHIDTNKFFWCFYVDENVNKYLSMWSNKSNLIK